MFTRKTWPGWLLTLYGAAQFIYRGIDFVSNIDFVAQNYKILNLVYKTLEPYLSFIINPPGYIDTLIFLSGCIWLGSIYRRQKQTEKLPTQASPVTRQDPLDTHQIPSSTTHTTNQIASGGLPLPLSELSVTTARSDSDKTLVLVLENQSTEPLRNCMMGIESTHLWSETTNKFITYSHLPAAVFFKEIKILEPETKIGSVLIGKERSQIVLRSNDHYGNYRPIPLTRFGIYKFNIGFFADGRFLRTEFFVNLHSAKSFEFTDDPRKSF